MLTAYIIVAPCTVRRQTDLSTSPAPLGKWVGDVQRDMRVFPGEKVLNLGREAGQGLICHMGKYPALGDKSFGFQMWHLVVW